MLLRLQFLLRQAHLLRKSRPAGAALAPQAYLFCPAPLRMPLQAANAAGVSRRSDRPRHAEPSLAIAPAAAPPSA